MAIEGEPRDMEKWKAVVLNPAVRFPGETGEYRNARNGLPETEAELRRLNEKVAAQRRTVPPGGLVKEDYVFEAAGSGPKVVVLAPDDERFLSLSDLARFNHIHIGEARNHYADAVCWRRQFHL